MKVMHILNSNSFSGAENVVISIIRNAVSSREKDSYIYVSPKGNIEEKLKKEHIQYKMLSKLTTKNLKVAIKEFKPDVIHAHDFTASVISALATIGTKVKLISHIHKNDSKMMKINIYSIIYLLSTIKYNKIFLVSKAIKEEYIFGKLIKKKIEVIGNPIDIKSIRMKAKKHDNYQKYDMLYLGRLSNEKNPTRFIEIIANVKNKIPNIKCGMVGDRIRKKQM